VLDFLGGIVNLLILLDYSMKCVCSYVPIDETTKGLVSNLANIFRGRNAYRQERTVVRPTACATIPASVRALNISLRIAAENFTSGQAFGEPFSQIITRAKLGVPNSPEVVWTTSYGL
jgi:hypothetical protein